MKIDWSEPGYLFSGAGHAAILVAAVVGISSAKPFADADEAIAVEMVTAEQLRAITQGERRAQPAERPPTPRVDRVADRPVENEQKGEDLKDAPLPPARAPDPKPEAKPEPQVAVATPPPAPVQRVEPEPAKPEPAKPEPPRAQPAPTPPRPPEPPQKVAEESPEPPRRPDPPKPEQKPEPPKIEPLKPVQAEKPKPVEVKPPTPRPDEIRKVIEQAKAQETPKPQESAKPQDKPKPQPAREQGERTFNPNDISKLLQSKEKAQSTGSAGQQVQRQASLGAPTGRAQKLSLSQRDALVGIIADQLRSCWSAPPSAETARGLVPRVRLALNTDGTLSAQPVVTNPSGDPVFRAIADSALRATRRCAPFRIPAQFAPYYDDWKSWVVDFDPKDMLG